MYGISEAAGTDGLSVQYSGPSGVEIVLCCIEVELPNLV